MSSQAILDGAITIALVLLTLSFLLTIVRIVRGPTLPDRILGLDMLVAAAIGYIAVIGIKTGYTLYVDIAIALGLVGFLATVAFARFILVRGQADEAGTSDHHELTEEDAISENIEKQGAQIQASKVAKPTKSTKKETK